jgi:uncharacterized protein GlcG (DUF336 family)
LVWKGRLTNGPPFSFGRRGGPVAFAIGAAGAAANQDAEVATAGLAGATAK